MADRDTDLVVKMIDERLTAIAHELHHLNKLLEGYKTATEREMREIEAKMTTVRTLQRSVPAGIPQYLSGRWPLRDGDTYGIVAPQPPLKLMEPTDGAGVAGANDKAGDIRSTDER